MTELSPRVLEAIRILYQVASIKFGSMDVDWWISVAPGPFAGPEVRLRMIVGPSDPSERNRKLEMTLTHSGMEQAHDQLEIIKRTVDMLRRRI